MENPEEFIKYKESISGEKKAKKFIVNNKALTIWVSLTILYILLLLITNGNLTSDPSLLGSFIGLFVPSAVWITIITQGVSILVLFAIMIFIDFNFKRMPKESFFSKNIAQIFYILIILFILTFFADLIVVNETASLDMFLSNFD